MSDAMEALKGDVSTLKTEFHAHRQDVGAQLHKMGDLMERVVTVQARQEESARSTRKLFEKYDALSSQVHKLEIAAAGGQVKVATNERLVWFVLTLVIAAAGVAKSLGG